MSKKLFIVGVGPGSPKYLTDIAKDAIRKSCYIVGYKYTLSTIDGMISKPEQKVLEVTMLYWVCLYLLVQYAANWN